MCFKAYSDHDLSNSKITIKAVTSQYQQLIQQEFHESITLFQYGHLDYVSASW